MGSRFLGRVQKGSLRSPPSEVAFWRLEESSKRSGYLLSVGSGIAGGKLGFKRRNDRLDVPDVEL